MTKEAFTSIILKLQLIQKKQHQIYKAGLDIGEFTDDHFNVISTLMESVFDTDQLGWINWFLYERPSFGDEPLCAYQTLDDGTKVEICYDIDSLWEELNTINKVDNK